MKHFSKFALLIALSLAALPSLAQDIVTPAGRAQWGDSVRWGDTDDSTSYLLVRGNVIRRDSSSTWVAITTDSCSLPVRLERGSAMHASKLELSYEVRTSSGNTDSSQVKWYVDTRYCKGAGYGKTCDSWVPAGRYVGDTASRVVDSITSKATASGVTWKPTRQIFDVPGGHEIRLCVDSYQAGGQTNDSTFFRKHIVRTSAVPSGGTEPGGSSLPSGAATAANQTTGNSSLSSIDSRLGDLVQFHGSAADLGSPVIAGYGSSTVPAATSPNGDVTQLWTDLNGRLQVSVTQRLDSILVGTTMKPVKYAVIDAATSGDNTLLAAVASNRIRVLSLFLVSAGTVNTRFESGASGTALTGQMNLVANSGFTLPYNPGGWFETAVNTLLNLELSAAISVDGSFSYIEVP